MISCLCITYNRPEFHDFLLWNFKKQTYDDKELVLVDGSDINYENKFKARNIRYIYVQDEANIPVKRNIALKEAKGDYITWFDDDDWQHPRKCEILVNELEQGNDYVGSSKSVFFNILTNNDAQYRGSKILFNSIGVSSKCAKSVTFDEAKIKASDNQWKQKIEKLVNSNKIKIINDPPLFFWLCHDKNISNPGRLRKGNNKDKEIAIDVLLENEKSTFFEHLESIRGSLKADPHVVDTQEKLKVQKSKPVTNGNKKAGKKPIIKNQKKLTTAVSGNKLRSEPQKESKSINRKTNALVGINVWNQLHEAKKTYLSFVETLEDKNSSADFLVVDDCSTDPKVSEYFSGLTKKGDIHYVRNKKQLRLTRSWNILLAYAVENNYEYVIQSNADVRFSTGWLDRFIKHLETGAKFLVPLTNQPGRYSSKIKYHYQDIRGKLENWNEHKDPQKTADLTSEIIIENNIAEPLPSANGFFIGFRTDFLKEIELDKGIYWCEDAKYLAANKGIGGDESEIRKRTGVQTYLACDVYIHHMRPYGKNGSSRSEFFRSNSLRETA